MGLRQVELFFIALVICQSSGALRQSPGVFIYGQPWDSWLEVPENPQTLKNISIIQDGDVTCLGGLQPYSSLRPSGVLGLSNSGSSTANISGSCLYNKPLKLIQLPWPGDGNQVNSFGTMFEVTIHSPSEQEAIQNSSPPQTKRFQTLIATDNSTLGGGGDYMGWLNSTTNGQASKGHSFAVNINFPLEDPYHLHIGVDQNAASTSTDIVEWGWNVTDVLKYESNVTFRVWVQYDGLSHILQVFLSRPDLDFESVGWSMQCPERLGCQASGRGQWVKPTQPIISTTLSLMDTFFPAGFSALGPPGMYVGFSGSISVNHLNSSGTKTMHSDIQYLISQWTFNSDGLAPDVPRDAFGIVKDMSEDYEAQRKHHQQRMITIEAVTIPSIVVFLCLIYIICLLYLRNARLTALTKTYDINIGVLNRGGCNFKYKALSAATKGFSSSELLGSGGFGSVTKVNYCSRAMKNQPR